MQRSIFALSVSMAVILITLIVFTWPRARQKDVGIEVPKGIPPSQRAIVQQPRAESPQVKAKDDVPESAPAEPEEWLWTDLKVRATFGGEPLAGARMTAQLITVRPDTGHRESMHLFDFSTFENERQSDHDGNIGRRVRYPVDTPEDALFGVAIFHSEKGTAYDEISIADLLAGAALDLEPAIGEVLIGRVVDKNGEPIPDARVSISTGWPHEGVCLSGLGARSGPDGTFVIPGLRFDNKPSVLHASVSGRKYNGQGRSLTEAHGAAERLLDSDTDFSPGDNVWSVGDVSIASIEQWAMDTRTGEVAPLPSDE